MRRLWPAAALVLVYLWAFPYFGKLRSANELPRVLVSQEIVRRGTFQLDARQGELGSRFDIAAARGHFYSNKAPGVSMLGVPVVAALDGAHRLVGAKPPGIAETTWALRVFAVTLPCLAFLWWFWRGTARFAGVGDGADGGGDGGGGERARRAALLALALGSMALPYGMLFFSHALAAAAAGGAFLCAIALARGEPRRPDVTAVACGALAGAAVLVDYQALLASAAVGAYLLWRSRRRVRDVALAAAGAVPPMLLLLGYHAACFGSPWKTGYSFAADPAHKQGVLGVIGPNREAMWNALGAPDNGLVVLAPWVLLAVVGGVVIARDRAWRERVGAEALVCGVVAAMYVLFVGSLVPEFGRAGWSVGPRYIAVAMPFLAWLACAALAAAERRAWTRIGAQALVLVGVGVHVVAASTYPHWPTVFENPLFEVSFRALHDGLAPHSVGTALGLSGVWSLAPLFAAALALCWWAVGGKSRTRALTGAAALVLAFATIHAYAHFPRTGRAGDRPWAFVKSSWEP